MPRLLPGIPMPRRSLLAPLALFGAFAVAYNLAVFVHEGGHFLASLLVSGAGARRWELLVHPFSVSYVWMDDWSRLGDTGRAWILAGGMLTGIVVGGAAVPVALRRAPGSFSSLLAWSFVACSGMLNGLYLLTALLVPWGDVGALFGLGLPGWAAVVVGLPVAGVWLWADVRLLRSCGLASPDVPWPLLRSVLGAVIYPGFIVAWQVFVETEPAVPLAVYLLYAAAVALWMAAALPPARRSAQDLGVVEVGTVARLLLAGLAVSAALLAVGPVTLGG